MGRNYRFRFVVEAREDIQGYAIGLLIRTPRGLEVLGTDSIIQQAQDLPQILTARSRYNFDIDFVNNFAPGTLFLTASIALRDRTKLDMRFDCLSFEVVGPETLYHSSVVSCPLGFSCTPAVPARCRCGRGESARVMRLSPGASSANRDRRYHARLDP
jgi:hypothetical protein